MLRLVAMRHAVTLLLLLSVSLTAEAQRPNPPVVDVPVIDTDNSAEGYRAPSMAQSLALTAGFYEVSHYAIEESLAARPTLAKWTIALFDFGVSILAPMPLTDVWLHEEFHRAVMANRGIDSSNDVYKFEFAAESVAVSGIRDEDLVRLKRDHPADLARLHAAGVEGEYALVQKLQCDAFFERARGLHLPLYLLSKISARGYIGSGTSSDTITETHEWEAEEGADISRRDFAGHDFTAWIYDMSRRDEAYTARGIHPSGVGIRRYITPDMLTSDERSFLDRQGRLQWLNFVDPHLAGIPEWRSGQTRWTASAGHVLTPFGYSIDANVLMSRATRNLAVTLHRYSNRDRSFGGVDVELVRQPLAISGRTLSVSPRIALWQQPEGLRWRTSDGAAGGLLAVRVEVPMAGRWSAWIDGSAKTDGWVMGDVHLESAFEVRFGGSVRLWEGRASR